MNNKGQGHNNTVNKFDNQHEIETFLERQITNIYSRGNNLNSFMSAKEIEFVVQIPFYKENIQPRFLHWQVLQTFKEEIMPVLNNLF